MQRGSSELQTSTDDNDNFIQPATTLRHAKLSVFLLLPFLSVNKGLRVLYPETHFFTSKSTK